MEALDGRAVGRLEGEVDVRGRRAVGGDEELVGLEVARPLVERAEAEHVEGRGVEALAGLEVGDAQVDVVEEAARAVDGRVGGVGHGHERTGS